MEHGTTTQSSSTHKQRPLSFPLFQIIPAKEQIILLTIQPTTRASPVVACHANKPFYNPNCLVFEWSDFKQSQPFEIQTIQKPTCKKSGFQRIPDFEWLDFRSPLYKYAPFNFLLLFYWAIRQRFLNNQTFTILSQDTGTLR